MSPSNNTKYLRYSLVFISILILIRFALSHPDDIVTCSPYGSRISIAFDLSKIWAVAAPICVILLIIAFIVWNTYLRRKVLQSADALKQSEKKYRSIFENAVEGIFQVLPSGRILSANYAFAHLLGYENQEELISANNKIYDFFSNHNDWTELLNCFIRDKVKNYETVIIRNNTEKVYISINAYAIRDSRYNLLYIEGIAIDITERKQAEEGLKKSKEELEIRVAKRTKELSEKNEQLNCTNEELNTTLERLKTTQSHLVESGKMASLGQLTAGIAHEINNPINFVSANIHPLKLDVNEMYELIKNLQRKCKPGITREEIIEVQKFTRDADIDFIMTEILSLLNGIEEGAARTKEIVMGLRNFSHLDEDDFKTSDIHQGINSTITLLKNKWKKRISIKNDFGKIPPVECLPGKINQVFMNILTNAIDAIEGEGEILIKTRVNNNLLTVSIKDSGNGMSEAVKNRIFEPFYTTKDVGKGTGLGMAIVYGIIEKHNGEIHVESSKENGTEVFISIPVRQ